MVGGVCLYPFVVVSSVFYRSDVLAVLSYYSDGAFRLDLTYQVSGDLPDPKKISRIQ